jgi:phosphoribosylformimino-5-aminoimidazole carboxamide ribonucleotide (ProFAR) isomerase
VAMLGSLAASVPADILVAGGVTDLAAVTALSDAGVSGVILGEAIFRGALDYAAALQAATGQAPTPPRQQSAAQVQ